MAGVFCILFPTSRDVRNTSCDIHGACVIISGLQFHSVNVALKVKFNVSEKILGLTF
jgi:hypothetical protein